MDENTMPREDEMETTEGTDMGGETAGDGVAEGGEMGGDTTLPTTEEEDEVA